MTSGSFTASLLCFLRLGKIIINLNFSKVILTIRDNEEIWAKSMAKQLEEESSPYILLMSYLSPTFKKFWKFYQLTCKLSYHCCDLFQHLCCYQLIVFQCVQFMD